MNSSAAPDTSLPAAIRSIWSHRKLILEMSRREVIGRYRGSLIGIAWSFLNPLLMLLVYTFVFVVVFQARWPGAVTNSNGEFAVVLFAGLIVYALAADCINRAPGLVIANANYVKKVVFPLEILAVNALAASLFHAAVSFVVLLLAYLALRGSLHLTLLAVPLVLLPLLVGTLGVAWILASLGVFMRDIGQTIGLITTAMMFLSPIFFPVAAVPREFQGLIELNPLTFFIEAFRGAALWGRWPEWDALVRQAIGATAVAAVGFWWFQKTRKGFADVV